MSGNMTWYNDAGNGACGVPVVASSQLLVAVSSAWWTTPNPNDDPICQGVSVQVTYHGVTITLPVEDKCPTCSATHIDLSEPAFAQLAPLSEGNVSGITWEFVNTGAGGAGSPPPLSAPPSGVADAAVPGPAPTSSSGSGLAAAGVGCAPAWDPGTSYVPGQVVSYNGQNWTAPYYSTGAVPSDPASWAVWNPSGPCG